jgi:PEGA domain/PDZ domain
MRFVSRVMAMFLSAALISSTQGNTFDRVRYNGGSVDSKVDSKDWHNHLTVTSDMITMDFADGKKLEIPPKSLTGLSYGQEAHRRVGTMVALAILIAPVALFGLLHKTRLHFIGIQYTMPDGKSAGILLQGDKDNYRAILVALQGVSGVPVSVGEKEREFVPVGVKTDVTKNSGQEEEAEKPAVGTESSAAAASSSPARVAEDATGAVTVNSVPNGADIYVDGDFVGNSPATLKLNLGRHTLVVKADGYQDWQRELTVSGGTVNLNVKLTAGASAAPAVSPASTAPEAQHVSAPVNTGGVAAEAQRSTGTGWIGVTTKDDANRGVVITRVLPDTSASQAGLKEGDIITSLDGKPVKSGMEFDVGIARTAPGSQIRVGYIRGVEKFDVAMIVGKIG